MTFIPPSDIAGLSSNILVNGGFETWNFGTSYTNPVQNTLLADKWVMDLGGSPIQTITRDTSANVDSGAYCLKMDITNVNSSTTSRLYQEIPNYTDYRGKTVTLSVRVKTNAATNCRLYIYDGFTNNFGTPHSGGNTFETLTVTATMNTAATRFSVYVGFISAVNVSTTYYDSAMLVLGAVPTPFVPTSSEIEALKDSGTLSLLQSNIIYNGGFEIHQNTNSNTNNNYVSNDYFFDGWKFTKNSTRQMNGGYETSSIFEGAGSLKADSLSGNTSADYVYQRVEDSTRYRGKYITLSIAVKCNTASAVRVAIDDNIASVNLSPFHTGGNAFEILTVSALISNTCTALNLGIAITAQSTTFIDAAMAVIGVFTQVPFIPTDPGVDLMRCQRYYEKSYALGVAPGTNTTLNPFFTIANGGTGQSFTNVVSFKATKRTNPTMTVYDTTGNSGKFEWGTLGAAFTSRTSTSPTSGGVVPVWGFSVSQAVNATDNGASGHWVADARL